MYGLELPLILFVELFRFIITELHESEKDSQTGSEPPTQCLGGHSVAHHSRQNFCECVHEWLVLEEGCHYDGLVFFVGS